MALLPQTRALLQFLQRNPQIRAQIRAAPDATVLYAGMLMKPAWKEIDEMRLRLPQMSTKRTLPEVLQSILLPGTAFVNLLHWVQSLDSVQPYKENGFIAWRAVSGIFASNAVGKVSFVIGSGVTRAEKVFAATELRVLMRNPRVDEITKDLLEYYQRCIDEGRPNLNLSFISA
jgi:hypothetical protein